MTKPTFLLMFSGGLASTASMLKAVRESRPPLLYFFYNQGPAGEGEYRAAKQLSSRYGLPMHTQRYAAINRIGAGKYEAEMIESACDFARDQGLTAVALARRTFFTDMPPPLRTRARPALYLPLKEYADEDYRAALDYEPALFRETFSCTESYNAVPCGKCAKCIEREALHARVRNH